MKLHIALVLVLATSCASSKPQMVSDNLDDVKGRLGDKEIGYADGEKEPVIMESVAVEDALRAATWGNYELERKLHTEHDELIECRSTLADPRLGGKKKIHPIPDLELAEDPGKIREKIGLTQSDRIKIVRRQDLREKLQLQKNYNESLTRLLHQVSQYNVECQQDLGFARSHAGLPARPEKAQGHYDAEGHFVLEKRAEEDLDDAFRRVQRAPANKNGEDGQ